MATTEQIAMALEGCKGRLAPVIVVENVCKSFGTQIVLNGISLTVSRAETLRYLGAAVPEKAYY